MPHWLKKFRSEYRDSLLKKAQKSYKDTGIWFLIRGAERDSDEQETYAVYGDLMFFFSLEDLPGYSKKNLQQAIRFWQSWQNQETGKLYNPLYQDPQNPKIKRDTPGNRNDYSADKINLKYIPDILALLGAELPAPCAVEYCAQYENKLEDTFDQIWEAIEQWNSSHAGAFVYKAAQDLDSGNTDRIPQIWGFFL